MNREKREIIELVVNNCFASKRSLLDGYPKSERYKARLVVETTLRGFLALDRSDQSRIYDLGVERELAVRSKR